MGLTAGLGVASLGDNPVFVAGGAQLTKASATFGFRVEPDSIYQYMP